jgi:CheY-like chemotaxis protein
MAEDGVEAMQHLAADARFHAIICDVLMPHCSGIQVYCEVSRLHPGLESRIVFITGGAFDPEDQQFLDTVPNQVVLKPFDLIQLRALVGEIMAQ